MLINGCLYDNISICCYFCTQYHKKINFKLIIMKRLLLVMFAVLFTALSYTQDLFFSEYIEGSGNNKCVEIYNPTSQAINLKNYYVVRFSNGSSVFTEGGVTHLGITKPNSPFQVDSIIDPYTTFVLVNGQTTSTSSSPACSPILQAMADQLDGDYPAPTYMNGNDAIALIKTPGGEAPSADMSNVTSVDLIGQIGLGNLISSETGWSYIQDSLLSYSNSNGDPMTGEVINYIVQKNNTAGGSFGPYWMSWTSNHSLIRKPTVVTGILVNPDPFIVTMEWDTVSGYVDSLGYIVYVDIWDNLGSHGCVADPNYTSVGEFLARGTLKIYPNPVVSDKITFESSAPVKSVHVFDIKGNEIIKNVYASPVNGNSIYIGSQTEGVYLVKVIFEDNSSTTQKILIK